MASMAWDRATAGEQDPNLHLLSGTDGRRGDDDCKERVIAEGPPTLVGAGVFLVALIGAVPFLFVRRLVRLTRPPRVLLHSRCSTSWRKPLSALWSSSCRCLESSSRRWRRRARLPIVTS
jgi:hypothetical protein